jgi:prepilin-type N-terminal cleavage/methylation domain-containing protein
VMSESARRSWREGGFSAAELLVTVAILGILTAIGVPYFLSYWRAATLRAGAEELAGVLNDARQLAISRNRSVCVSNDGTRVSFHLDNCGNPAVTRPGTDGQGWIRLTNGQRVAGSTANVTFNYLGAATTAATYTVQSPNGGATLCVAVAASGRVRIGPCS